MIIDMHAHVCAAPELLGKFFENILCHRQYDREEN